MTPEERALLDRFLALQAENVGMPYSENMAKTLNTMIRESERARDERAAKIAESVGAKMQEIYSERECEEVGDAIAAAIRSLDTTPSP